MDNEVPCDDDFFDLLCEEPIGLLDMSVINPRDSESDNEPGANGSVSRD